MAGARRDAPRVPRARPCACALVGPLCAVWGCLMLSPLARPTWLGPWLQTASNFEIVQGRLADEPQFSPPLGGDLTGFGELAQPFMADRQLVCRNRQQYQAVLSHGGDSTAYPQSLPQERLPLPQITGRIAMGNPKQWEPLMLTSRRRERVFERDGYACCYCGAGGPDVVLEPDHVIPLRLRGEDTPANLVTACRPCNRSKGAHTLDCWRAGRGCRATSVMYQRWSANCRIGGLQK